MRPTRRAIAFTLTEVLVVIAIISVVIAIVFPIWGKARSRADEIRSAARVRQIGTSLGVYARDFNDLPPVTHRFRPGRGAELPPLPLDEDRDTAEWFWQTWFYIDLIRPPLPLETLLVPGAPVHSPVVVDGVRTSRVAHYDLSESLYTSPAYWDPAVPASRSHFVPQRLSSVAFPSSKGLAIQSRAFREAGVSEFLYLPSVPWLRGAVLWGDQSVSVERVGSLRDGAANRLYRPASGYREWPVVRTAGGVLGRDR